MTHVCCWTQQAGLSPVNLSLLNLSDIMILTLRSLGGVFMSSRNKVPFLHFLTERLKTDGMSRAYDQQTTVLYREKLEGKVN